MNRGLWFVAGAGAGVYAVVKVRRAAEAFTPDGLRDRLSGLGLGAHLFAEEVRAGMAEKETELRERLHWALDGPRQLGRGAGEGFETLAGTRSSTTEGVVRTRSSTTDTTTDAEKNH
jgi:hypothetical protein